MLKSIDSSVDFRLQLGDKKWVIIVSVTGNAVMKMYLSIAIKSMVSNSLTEGEGGQVELEFAGGQIFLGVFPELN